MTSARHRILLLNLNAPEHSGTGVLADRVLQVLGATAGRVVHLDVTRPPVRPRLLEETLAAHDGPSILFGLPEDPLQAQLVLDLLVSSGRGVAVLWERVGFSVDQAGEGLRLDPSVHLVFINTAHRLRSVERHPRNRHWLMPLCTPDTFFRTPIEPRQGAEREPACLFTGRAHQDKGLPGLLRELSGTMLPISLKIRLNGAMGCQIPDNHRLTVDVRHLEDPETRAIEYSSSLCLFPARSDNLPQALIEAMASGAMVLATDIVGHSAAVRDGIDGHLMASDLSDLERRIKTVSLLPAAQACLMRREARRAVLHHRPSRAAHPWRTLQAALTA